MNKQGDKGIEWTRIIQSDGTRLPGVIAVPAPESQQMELGL